MNVRFFFKKNEVTVIRVLVCVYLIGSHCYTPDVTVNVTDVGHI